jgi:hypothetical protein
VKQVHEHARLYERMVRDIPLMRGPDGNRLITPPLLPLKGINYNRNHLRRLWNAGLFPRPIKLSARKLAWRESEIDEWLASRVRE